MRIIRELHRRRPTWQVARLTYPDGRVHYHTGSAIKADDLLPGRGRPHNWYVTYYRDQRIEIDLVDNFVFEARLRPSSGRFVNPETGLAFWANPSRAFDIYDAAIAGRVPVVDGHIAGQFTFRNIGGKVTLVLVDEGQPAEVPADAPDLTDFVRGLGREG